MGASWPVAIEARPRKDTTTLTFNYVSDTLIKLFTGRPFQEIRLIHPQDPVAASGTNFQDYQVVRRILHESVRDWYL